MKSPGYMMALAAGMAVMATARLRETEAPHEHDSEPLPTRPGPARRRQVRSANFEPTAYAPKTPITALDHARLDAAAQKRARKAARTHGTTGVSDKGRGMQNNKDQRP